MTLGRIRQGALPLARYLHPTWFFLGSELQHVAAFAANKTQQVMRVFHFFSFQLCITENSKVSQSEINYIKIQTMSLVLNLF